MAIYRIKTTEGIVGCVAAKSKSIANAYALGKYGAGAEASKVPTKEAMEVFGICVLIETHKGENQRSRAIN